MGIRTTTPEDVSGSVVGSSGQIATAFGQLLGVAFFFNASPYDMTVATDDGMTVTAPSNCMKRVRLFAPSQQLSWTVISVPNSANPPTTLVFAELYDRADQAPDIEIASLGRQFNVGNGSVAVSSAQSVKNDGNAAPTEVVEGTPSGKASSELIWNNDGSGTFGGGNDVVDATGVFTSMPAGAIPGAAVAGTVARASQLTAQGSGTAGAVLENASGLQSLSLSGYGADEAIALNAHSAANGDVQVFKGNADGSASLADGNFAVSAAGALTAGTIPAANVGSGYPAADLSGSVPSATQASELAAGGALLGSATIPRGDAIEDASDSATTIGVAGDGAAEIASFGHDALLASDQNTSVRFNAKRASGGGDTYMDSANPAIDWYLNAGQEHWWQHRFAGVGTKGAAITWTNSAFTMIQDGISGSGSATVSHGLQFTPFAAIVNTDNGSNSTTYGSGSYSSTSVFVFQFNAQSWRGFVAA